MIELKGEFLEEVKPAFIKQSRALLKEASQKIREAKKLISDAKEVAEHINYGDSFNAEVEKIVIKANYNFIGELQSSMDSNYGETDPELKSKPRVTLKVAKSGKVVEAINLVSGRPLQQKRKYMKRNAGEITRTKSNNPKSVMRYAGKRKIAEYRGVSFVKGNSEGKQYRSRLMHNKVEYEIGFFSTDLEAAYAYDEKKYSLRGDLLGLNFPDRIESRLKKKALEESK